MSETTPQTEPPIGSRVRAHGAIFRRFEDGRWRVEEDTMTWFGLTRDGAVEVVRRPSDERGELPAIDPEPEWLTTLKARMTELQDPDGDNRVPRFAAVKVAFQMLRDAHARIEELERERDEAAGRATRLAKLLAAPAPTADEYASLKTQLKFDVHTAFANQLLTDAQLFEDAKHWQTGAASRLLDAIEPEIDRYIAAMLRDEPVPSPEVGEVPAGEAREGDTVTIVGKFRMEVGGNDGSVYVEYRGVGPGAISDSAFSLINPQVTVTRPSIPLPTEPGTVIRCRIQNSPWKAVAELGDDSHWHATDGCRYLPVDVTEFTVLTPAAGVSERGKP